MATKPPTSQYQWGIFQHAMFVYSSRGYLPAAAFDGEELGSICLLFPYYCSGAYLPTHANGDFFRERITHSKNKMTWGKSQRF